MRFFNFDSPLMQVLGKVGDLMILNLLTLFCCLPIITAGASLTALNYMALKIVRGEDVYIVRGFFKSFKENFRQSTVIWLLFIFLTLVLAADYKIMLGSDSDISGIAGICILAVSILELFTFTFVFPVQAKFANPVLRTIRNSFMISIMQFPKTVLIVVMYLIPPALILLTPALVPIVLMFGMSVPAMGAAKLYNKFFGKLEDKIRAENGEEPVGNEDEHIFSDEVLMDEYSRQNH